MAQRPATVLEPAKIDLLRKALTVAPMTLDLTGLSMYPSIRLGDRCRVAAVDPDHIQEGDILLTTREARIFAHRVVGMEPGPPRQWIIKGDTLLVPDPPVRAEDILGQVLGIERRGRYIDLRSPMRRRLGRAMASVSGPYSRAFMRAVMLRRRALSRLAALPAWRARRRAAVGHVDVRPAIDSDVEGIAVLFGEQQAVHRPMERIDMGMMRLHARNMLSGARAVGATVWVAVVDGFLSGHAVIGPLQEPTLRGDDWWVMSVYTRMTVRGAGVAERMVRAGLDHAAQRGRPSVRYAAFATNRASLNLARKLGFTSDETDEARRFAAHYEAMDPRAPRLHVLRKDLDPMPKDSR